MDQEFLDECVQIALLHLDQDILPSPFASPNITPVVSPGVTLVASPTITLVDSPALDSKENTSLYPGTFSDFHGLPSNPVCIYRTGDKWRVPTGFDAQPVLREARPICKHPIQHVWSELGTEIYQYLDSVQVKWSTIDPVRFAEEGEDAGPLYLWVGVEPKSLSLEKAQTAAAGCKDILANANLQVDVEIAFRESRFIQSTGQRLLNYAPYIDPTADVISPFTPALGIQIAPQRNSHSQGTGALYLCESSQTDRVLILTARHVIFPPPSNPRNELYVRNRPSTRVENVLVLGCKAYSDAITEMLAQIGKQSILAGIYKDELSVLGEPSEGDDVTVTTARQDWQDKLTKAERSISKTHDLHKIITRNWTSEDQRILGHVVHAPPISFSTGPKEFTEDWALIELNRNKINWDEFKGNVIYLGNMISGDNFVKKMHPHPQSASSFKFPTGGLLKIKGIVREDEIRSPKQLDANGEECLLVIKNGGRTKVTIGRGSGIESFVRTIDDYGLKQTSKEFGVYPYSRKDGPFSACGDSGSIVVDGKGRIVGLLTAGAGTTNSTDVTYITPYFWLHDRIKHVFPNSYLYPAA